MSETLTLGDGRTVPCLPGVVVKRLPPGGGAPPAATAAPKSSQLRGARLGCGDGCGRVGGVYDRRGASFVARESV